MFANLQNTRYMQYICAITATLSALAGSMHGHWTSPALVALQSDDSPIGRPITDEEGSWIVSLLNLAVIPTAILAAWLVEKIGRKYCLLLVGIMYVLPWFMILFAKTVWILYIARFTAGIGAGLLIISCTIYLGEIAENDIRGKIVTFRMILNLIGGALVLCIGPYISYRALIIMSLTIAVLYLCLCVLIPESPYYLVKKNRLKEAEERVKFLSGKRADDKFISARLAEIENSVKEDMQNKTTAWEFLSNPEYRRAIIIMFGVKTLHQFSGITAINGYMQTIVGLSESSISAEASSMIFGIVQVPAVMATGLLVDKVGRKPLWIVSAVGCAIALIAEGIFFYCQDVLQADVTSIAWIPTTGIALFLIMNTLGVVPLPYVLLGEIFPANIKGIAAGAASFYGGSLSFLVGKFFKPLSNAWGIHVVFFMFASTCILGAIFVIIMLPETKGKSFSEIQAIMKNKKGDSSTSKKDALSIC